MSGVQNGRETDRTERPKHTLAALKDIRQRNSKKTLIMSDISRGDDLRQDAEVAYQV